MPSNLVEIMRRLRDPERGCPWDLEQDFNSIAPYTIEEAYEVADAIERANMDDLQEELGDLWLQVVFHAQMAEEAGHFNLDDVEQSICDKMIRRHPHVFADATVGSADEQTVSWEAIKAAEKSEVSTTNSRLDEVPANLPALMQAQKLGKKAGRTGFDWPDISGVWEKLAEEQQELSEAVDSGQAQDIEHELGDLLFSVVNLARHLQLDADAALRAANQRFRQRFAAMEKSWAASGIDSAGRSIEALEADWQKAKRSLDSQG